MSRLQTMIHTLEEGAGVAVIKGLLLVLVVAGLAITYNLREFRNFSNPEAMDQAQLARNVAEGRGFTTGFIRPLSLHQVARQKGTADFGLGAPHPDVANAPLYPLALAGLMKLAPFEFGIRNPAEFRSYQPELLIAWFNQGLLLLALGLTYRLGKRLFDGLVAWTAVALLAGTELFWRFSISGLSTMLVLVLVLALANTLASLESGARAQPAQPGQPPQPPGGVAELLFLALLAGALVALAGLTRYSLALLIVPVVVFLALSLTGGRRVAAIVVALVAFAGVLTPWLVRNYQLSGVPFGVAGFAASEETERFPGQKLPRSLHPRDAATPADLDKVAVGEYFDKLGVNLGRVIQDDLPKLGGNWVTGLFLAALLVRFRNPGLVRMRGFLVVALLVLAAAQALGRTHLSTASPEVNGENLLVALAPLVFVFGAGFFAMLLDQLDLQFPPARRLVIGVFVAICSLPLLLTFVGPRKTPVAYPPYYPPIIQEAAGWLKPDEVLMSDMPWAVAWYGHRPCVWLTWDISRDFTALHQQKPVQGLYLTPLTMDGRFLSQMLKGEERVWGRFAVESLVKEETPTGFPLKHAFSGWLPDQLFMADRPRWQESGK